MRKIWPKMVKQIAQIKHLTHGRDDAKFLDSVFCCFSKYQEQQYLLIELKYLAHTKLIQIEVNSLGKNVIYTGHNLLGFVFFGSFSQSICCLWKYKFERKMY